MNATKWNALPTKERKRLLKAAGHNANEYAYRAWSVVAHNVKLDLIYVARREASQEEVAHAA